MKRSISILLLLLLGVTANVEAAGILGQLKKWTEKAQRFFSGEEQLEDQALYSGNYVIAYEPYFLIEKQHFGKSSFHFHLLTDLVIGDYDIDPQTGKPRYEQAFKVHQTAKTIGQEENILQVSRKSNAKLRMLLNVSMHNDFGVSYENDNATLNFFSNKNAQQDTLINRLKKTFIVWEKKYDILREESGVVLDFQNFTGNRSRVLNNLMDFIKRIEETVGLVYLKLPAYSEKQSFFNNEEFLFFLKQHVDLFILKAYDFTKLEQFGVKKCIPPVNMFEVERWLKFYSENDSLIEAKNILIEFPNYAIAYDESEVEDLPPLRYVPIGMAYKKIAKSKKSYVDSLHRSYLIIEDAENRCTYCVEDSLTLAMKYQWVLNDRKCAGIGTMGLSYIFEGNATKQLNKWWWAKARTLARPTAPLGWSIASMLFLFICLGYIVAIAQHWQVRNILAKYQNRLTSFGLRFALFFFFFLLCADIIPRNFIGLLIIGAILGIFILMRIVKRYLAKVRRYGKYAQHV